MATPDTHPLPLASPVAAMLDAIIAALREAGIEPTPANVIAHATDRGAEPQLASDLAELVRARLGGAE